MTQKTNPWTFDVRVRERNLKSGAITEKDVEKYVGTLPDLAEQAEPFATSQPALAPREVAEPLDADEGDDEIEEEEESAAPADGVNDDGGV
ncbi:MAG: hypothetical protein KF819_36120 [Labilithrix sp.]|nr:hypothetical protein [Labilithrix sp.]